MAKTLVQFDKLIADMLVANGNSVEAVTNACQGELNSAKRVGESTAKRGNMTGGHGYKADGTLVVKPLGFKETETHGYEIPVTAGSVPWPGEFVKFHDSLVNHWKKTGRPVGPLPPTMLPFHLKDHLSNKCRADKPTVAKPTAEPTATKPTRRNGNIETVAVPAK